MNSFNTKDLTKSALLGLAVGDALGVPVEFLSREQVHHINLTEMIGKDTPIQFESRWGGLIPAGAWSDDTSMTVATMISIISQDGNINYDDIMRRFVAWWKGGEYCSLSFPFGLGKTVSKAMNNYRSAIPATECGPKGMWENGNGALMRILPVSLYCIFRKQELEKTVEIINAATAITHGHAISQMGCLIFTLFLKELLEKETVIAAWEATKHINYLSYYDSATLDAYRLLLSDVFLKVSEEQIGETGYVVDSLMTAVYSMLRGKNYEEAVLTAINLGYDTDTNAAITGALAGAFYGLESIPIRWLSALRRCDYLEDVAARFADALG